VPATAPLAVRQTGNDPQNGGQGCAKSGDIQTKYEAYPLFEDKESGLPKK
jgi:hypothetical protein